MAFIIAVECRYDQDAGRCWKLLLEDARVVRQLMTLDERDRLFARLALLVGFRQTGIPVESAMRAMTIHHESRCEGYGVWQDGIFSFSSLPLTIFYYDWLRCVGFICEPSCVCPGVAILTDTRFLVGRHMS